MRRTGLRVTLAIATALAWAGFLYLDAQWNACLLSSVEAANKNYGEMYGPLSFFRPIFLYSTLLLSLGSAVALALGAKRTPVA